MNPSLLFYVVGHSRVVCCDLYSLTNYQELKSSESFDDPEKLLVIDVEKLL